MGYGVVGGLGHEDLGHGLCDLLLVAETGDDGGEKGVGAGVEGVVVVAHCDWLERTRENEEGELVWGSSKTTLLNFDLEFSGFEG